ncbi:MAG: CoA-binding protein [Bacteroidota bacterium]
MKTVVNKRTTLVLGASEKADRYSNRAIHMLREYDEPVLALGLRNGQVGDVEIFKDRSQFEGEEIDTITLYLNPRRQREYYDWIVQRNPRRVIFNPGTENFELIDLLRENGIEPVMACTLVMLRTRQYA